MTLAEALVLPYGKQAHDELRAMYLTGGVNPARIRGSEVEARARWLSDLAIEAQVAAARRCDQRGGRCDSGRTKRNATGQGWRVYQQR